MIQRTRLTAFQFFIAKGNQNEAVTHGVQGERITVPHTWNVQDGLEDYAGKAVYTTEFVLSKPSYKTYLHFEAVYHSCSVYLNHTLVGVHSGSGYTPFELEITQAVRAGANLLTVLCDNAYTDKSLPHQKDFDWANDGGIIRFVELVEFSENCVRRCYIESGITDFYDSGACDAHIKCDLRLLEDASIPCTLRVTEDQGGLVYTEDTVADGRDYFFDLKNIRPWFPDCPQLYTLSVILPHGQQDFSFGVRKIETRGDKIFLNNREMRLLAVEWMPGSSTQNGMAETEGELESNLNMLKELNCNFTRFHWQQAEFVLDWCDRNGLMVQEEIPYWGAPKAAGEEQMELAMRQADEMLDYHFNHPSLVCWGVGNELGGHKKKTIRYVETLYRYFKQRDTMRLVNYVSNTMCFPRIPFSGETDRDATAVGDICMWNEYLGTWMQSSNFEKSMRAAKKRAEGKPLVITEFGLCEPAHKGGDERRISIYKEKLALYEKLGFAGWVYFCLNDYRTHVGESGAGKYKRRIHGSVDLEGNRKPSFDFIKSRNAADSEGNK